MSIEGKELESKYVYEGWSVSTQIIGTESAHSHASANLSAWLSPVLQCISNAMPLFLKCEREVTTIYPTVSCWIPPRRQAIFIPFLSCQKSRKRISSGRKARYPLFLGAGHKSRSNLTISTQISCAECWRYDSNVTMYSLNQC